MPVPGTSNHPQAQLQPCAGTAGTPNPSPWSPPAPQSRAGTLELGLSLAANIPAPRRDAGTPGFTPAGPGGVGWGWEADEAAPFPFSEETKNFYKKASEDLAASGGWGRLPRPGQLYLLH